MCLRRNPSDFYNLYECSEWTINIEAHYAVHVRSIPRPRSDVFRRARVAERENMGQWAIATDANVVWHNQWTQR